jgi:hypothetical protein
MFAACVALFASRTHNVGSNTLSVVCLSPKLLKGSAMIEGSCCDQ